MHLAVVILSAIFLVLWAIAPVRNFLRLMKLFDESTVTYIVVLLIAMIVTMIHELSERTRSVDDALTDRDRQLLERTEKIDKALAMLQPAQSVLIDGGISKVYPCLFEELNRARESERVLDVFGLTLITAWPQLKAWLAQPETPLGWTIRLLCLSPHMANRGMPWIRSEWYENARGMIQEIEAYLVREEAAMLRRNVRLTLHTYDCIPALHGFYLGNETLFVSCLRWDAKNQFDDAHHFYEKFEGSDRSDRAEAYRKLFSNWFEHAVQLGSAAHVSPPSPGI